MLPAKLRWPSQPAPCFTSPLMSTLLQAQQALMKVDWPEHLPGKAAHTRRGSIIQRGRQRLLQTFGAKSFLPPVQRLASNVSTSPHRNLRYDVARIGCPTSLRADMLACTLFGDGACRSRHSSQGSACHNPHVLACCLLMLRSNESSMEGPRMSMTAGSLISRLRGHSAAARTNSAVMAQVPRGAGPSPPPFVSCNMNPWRLLHACTVCCLAGMMERRVRC